MPLEIAFLLLLIILLRIIRRQKRWGAVEVSHIKYKEWIISPTITLSCYVKECPETPDYALKSKNISVYDPQIRQTTPKILLLSPLFAKPSQRYFLASALAQLGYDVVLISPQQLINLISADSDAKNPTSSLFFQILSELNTPHVILFDYAIYPIFQVYFQNPSKETPFSLSKLILIRPTCHWDHIKPFWHLVPGSIQWLSYFKFVSVKKKLLPFLKVHSVSLTTPASSQININSLIPSDFIKNLKIIHPSTSWVIPKARESLTEWEETHLEKPQSDSIYFSHGDWAFYRNETVVFGLIAQFLS